MKLPKYAEFVRDVDLIAALIAILRVEINSNKDHIRRRAWEGRFEAVCISIVVFVLLSVLFGR